MMLGSADFETYARNLRRLMWAEFIDEQIKSTREHQFRASIVGDPYVNNSPDLANHFDRYRNRNTSG